MKKNNFIYVFLVDFQVCGSKKGIRIVIGEDNKLAHGFGDAHMGVT